MPKDPITLYQLLQYLDGNHELIQIVDGNAWNSYSELAADSYLLEPFLNYKIKCLEAIAKDIIRVELIKPKPEKNEEETCTING